MACRAGMVIFLGVCAFAGSAWCGDSPFVSRETISGRVVAQNGFSWNSGYDAEVVDHAVYIRVAIKLIPAEGVTASEIDGRKQDWKAGIESAWGNRFALVTPSGKNLPIRVALQFTGPKFHHLVIVRPGRGRTDELNWNLQDNQERLAHEFGHMLGVYDEYAGGAQPLQGSVTDGKSLMTRNPSKEKQAFPRHYQAIREWFMDRTGFADVSLVPTGS